MKEITLIVKYSVKKGMVNDFLTALKNEGFPQIVQNENGCKIRLLCAVIRKKQ